MGMPRSVMLRSALISYSELRRALGVRGALHVLADVGRRLALGEPYRDVPPAEDARMEATRREMAPAVVLYRALCARRSEDEAFAIARVILLNASLIHLRAIYPDFVGGDFRALSGGADSTGEKLNETFPFADTRVVELSARRSSFDVVRCRVPEALRVAGAERLAPIFCEVDGIYFPIFEPAVELKRTKTIIHGGDVCDFRLRWKAERAGAEGADGGDFV